MKINNKILTIIFASVVVLGLTSFYNVSATDTPISNQQIDRIYGNCSQAKNTLNQLHASDALLRVNMGQIYESISTKLMTKFNSRVSNNKFDNNNLTSATNSYNSELDTFRSDYKKYEEQLNLAINVDCQKQQVSFYDAVALARTERNRVHDDIVRINQYIDQYQLAIDQFEIDYVASSNGDSK